MFLTCRVPPQVIGGFWIVALDAERLLVGAATIDPFHSSPGTACSGCADFLLDG